tara:strand:+ start:1999 stop:2289 length:291 start_codon:yes stop_codon:yes gene_type:complete
MTNPFFNKPDNVTNDIADILNKHRQDKFDAIPDAVKDAAKAAGAELRGMGRQPVETRNSVYNKHFTKAVGDSSHTASTRQSFEKMADQEFNTPPAE